MIRTLPDRIFSSIIFTLTLAFLVVMLLVGCTTPQARHVLSTFRITYGTGSGSYTSTGGFKTSEDVLRGSMDGDYEGHMWLFSIDPLAGLYQPEQDIYELMAPRPPKSDPCGDICPTCKKGL